MRNAQTFLRMETLPLWMGDVPFADGNAATRTFGRAHRRRPYHFSCGFVSQGCRKRLCRRTNTRNGWRKRLCRRTKTRKGCRKRLCRWTKTRNGCRKRLRRWTKSKKVAGEVLADDYPCGLSQERGSSDEMTARCRGRQAFAGEMMVLQNDVRLPVSRPLRKK